MNALQRNSRWWVTALYSLSFMLIVLPFWEGIGRLGEPAPSEVMWRAASIVSIAGVLMIPVVGFVLALVVAAAAEHRKVLIAGSVLGMLGALALVGAMGLVALDTLQMRRQVIPERLATYDQLLIRTVFSLLLFTLTTTFASLGAFRTARRSATASAAALPAERGMLAARKVAGGER